MEVPRSLGFTGRTRTRAAPRDSTLSCQLLGSESLARAAMKASVFVGTSLDGFIARKNGALDFLPAGGGEPHGYDEFFASVDALVIGRKTYQTVLAFEEWPYGRKP